MRGGGRRGKGKGERSMVKFVKEEKMSKERRSERGEERKREKGMRE